jgi:peptidoglycan/LPS O-acetylase OafA/YrhL
VNKGVSVSTTHPGYRADVDGLRALAVLSVIGFHAFPGMLRGGFVGVDIFFVISGFLISGLIYQALKENRFSYLDFYARRVRRIFPALFAVLATGMIVGFFWLYSTEYKELGKQAAAGAGFVANILFWSESGYFDSEAQTKPLLHLWSLGVEEQFYFFWPIMVVFFYQRSRRLVWMLAAVVLASFFWNIFLVRSDPIATFYLPMTRFWELLLGAILAYAATFRSSGVSHGIAFPVRISDEVLSAFGFTLISASLVVISENMAYPGWWAILPTTGALLVIAAPGAWLNRHVLANPIVVFVGIISYPLYLWHWLVLWAFARAELATRWDRLAAVAVSFLLAWLTYVFIERPIRFGIRSSARSIALVACTAIAGVSGWFVYATDGAAFRYPPIVRSLASYHYDGPADYREGLCQLDNDEPFAALDLQCIDPPKSPSTLLVLWGDSHASSLYQGLKAQKNTRTDLRIAQFTSSGCPPLVGGGQFGKHKTCESFADSALTRIRLLRPDIVVLEGFWLYYSTLDGTQRVMSALQHTIGELKAAGVRRVVVFGPLPRWLLDQPTVGLRLWEQTHELKWRTRLYLDPGSAPIDAAIDSAVSGTDAIFVSPMNLLCNSDGCLITTDRKTPIPLAWDNVHLTAAGSRLLIDLSSGAIFGN